MMPGNAIICILNVYCSIKLFNLNKLLLFWKCVFANAQCMLNRHCRAGEVGSCPFSSALLFLLLILADSQIFKNIALEVFFLFKRVAVFFCFGSPLPLGGYRTLFLPLLPLSDPAVVMLTLQAN